MSDKIILTLLMLALVSCSSSQHPSASEATIDARVWQWHVETDWNVSAETQHRPEAYLWIPEDCAYIRGVVFAQNNMIEEGMLESPLFRRSMRAIGFAEVWVSPMATQKFDFNTNEPLHFQRMMQKLADVSGYAELATAPMVPMGHSALATFPWNFAASNPQRTLAVVSIHGDAPQTHLTGYGKPNIPWGDRTIDGVPGLFVMGEYEWWEDRLTPGLKYQQEHPNSVITWFADAGHGHFDYSTMLIQYVAGYIQKAAQYRLSKDPKEPLKPLNPKNGWLMDRWRGDRLPQAEASPYEAYSGDRKVASWVFDKEMAEATEAYYAKARGKKAQYIGLEQEGKILSPGNSHAAYQVKFVPMEDGITFRVNAFFSDSTKISPSDAHAGTALRIDKITGPVRKLNDSTFQLHFGKLGFNNTKRSNDIWLLAHNEGDDAYKSVVQQFQIRFPLFNTDGKAQQIAFPPIPDQKKGVSSLKLNAVSGSGLPVSYYVKSGPAKVVGDELIFTPVPPKARYPICITVVAWQYGIAGKWQSAKPVERRFYLK